MIQTAPSSPAVAEIRAKTRLPLAVVESIVARVQAGTMTKADTKVFLDAGLIEERDGGFNAVFESATPEEAREGIVAVHCDDPEAREIFAAASAEDKPWIFLNLCDYSDEVAKAALDAGLVERTSSSEQ